LSLIDLTQAVETPADALVRQALEAFDTMVSRHGGLRSREGQRQMAEAVARTFAEPALGGPAEPPPERRIAVIQAGTGVGKSLAYSAPAIALALARDTRVLISTATVALQEQLVHKDLPALAAVLPQPFRFALAKGRGRYVCKLKLDRMAGPDGSEEPEDLFADEPPATTAAAGPDGEALKARRLAWQAMAQALASTTWDGDRDTLPTNPESAVWLPVAAEASSCTGKHCPLFSGCSYFEQRKALVGAQVIVANHDLLLSSLGSRVLPELDHCLLVLDEAHHLPAVALDQFTASTDLTRLRWIDQLAQRATQVGAALFLSDALDAPRLAADLRLALQNLTRAVVDALRPADLGPSARRVRLPQGRLPEGVAPLLDAVGVAADAWLSHLAAMARTLKAEIKDKPEDARRLSGLYAQMGTLAPRLEAVADTVRLLQAGGSDAEAGEAGQGVPPAKWFTFQTGGDGSLHVRAHACPTLPGTVLRQHLWPRVRATVLTSATLTSCGRFDFFLAESGLAGDADARALEVPSPFDFAAQGRFEVAETRADPREAAAFTAEMLDRLLADLREVRQGALVLFTSRDQMRQATDALPDRLRPFVLVQGEWPRTLLLQRHRDAVARGDASIVFGLQSFGEGLDLPGALCADLFIAKLPFASPDNPVEEARAEWLQAQGRNPFMELTVPATSVRLAQWAGRAIRTETDQARIVCYDRRLLRTPYGQRLLQGLPPFTRVRRPA
jgi:ATP-dependent DNA helicase DinG